MSKDLTQETTVLEGSIKPEFTDPNDSGNYATTPNADSIGVDQNSVESNLGGGLDAAKGMDYSWDKKAAERADYTYQSDVLNTKANFLTNRQNIESTGQQYQMQSDMQQYSNNQSADKVGWTGGYVLDSERQMNYLKSTIQAQMYGQMELQKHGYDTSLAAARLAYDTNRYDLALQYYQQAIQNAVTEANQTGMYISPETKEHLNQYKIAADIMNDPNSTVEQKQNADKLLYNIHGWFKEYGISPAGVKTLTKLAEERSTTEHNLTIFETVKNSLGVKDMTQFQIDMDSYWKVGEDGKPIISNDTQGETVNFDKMSNTDILNYATTHNIAKEQVYSYLDGLLYTAINGYLDTVKEETGSGDDKKTTYKVTDQGFREYLAKNEGVTITSLLTEALNSNQSTVFDNYTLDEEEALDGTPIYFRVKDGDLQISVGSKEGFKEGEPKPNAITGPNGETLTWDNVLNGYKESNTARVYDTNNKIIGYDTSDEDVLWETLNKDGYPMSEKNKRTFNIITQEQSDWGDWLKQADFNADKSKGEAGKYIQAIKKAAEDNLIPIGAAIKFNYGNYDSDNKLIYIYLGNGQFANVKDSYGMNKYDEFTEKIWTPQGYKKDGSRIIKE